MKSAVTFAVAILLGAIFLNASTQFVPHQRNLDRNETSYICNQDSSNCKYQDHCGYSEEDNKNLVLLYQISLSFNRNMTLSKFLDKMSFSYDVREFANKLDILGWITSNPEKAGFRIRHVTSKEDLVSIGLWRPGEDSVDLFRLDCGRIVEHWGVIKLQT
ncbi:unnamed protein product [Allacma fusca]|uniref:Uncharacterized protein n=1 Tax=Allacma fusca TaxID=39272 RepID=A0A8J2K023_9HEXA|nr:unnamed protein product [Allacma fusca]